MQNRKEFIRLAGMATAGIGLTGISGFSLSACERDKGMKTFGIQLYSVRDVLPADPKMVLKQLAGYGYKQLESYEGDLGMFWGMSATEFKKYVGGLGMTIVSSHCDIDKDFEKKAADAALIGMKYLVCPWVGPQKTLDDFKKLADKFNEKAGICKKNGLRFAYHNHDYSFKTLEGKIPQDVLMEGTDPSLVDFELDIYWVVTAGQDPEAWMKKYRNRFTLCHVKDRSKNPVPDNGQNSVDLGTGVINFEKVLKTARENGMNYYIVEQESYANSTPLKSAEAGAAYMKTLDI